jgi:hypothetical protein
MKVRVCFGVKINVPVDCKENAVGDANPRNLDFLA